MLYCNYNITKEQKNEKNHYNWWKRFFWFPLFKNVGEKVNIKLVRSNKEYQISVTLAKK